MWKSLQILRIALYVVKYKSELQLKLKKTNAQTNTSN